ncbi:MAG: RidA family protein [Acidimicrobiales bacterium]
MPEGGKPVGPYSPAVHAGDWVVTSGQIGAVVSDGGAPELVGGGTVSQLRQALANLETVLASQGASLADVVKTVVFLADISDYASLNEVWLATFPEPRPARSAIAVAALPLGASVEVEAWAYVPVR